MSAAVPGSPSVLPSLYARWMGEALAAPIPPESRATCDDCAMLVKDARPLLPSEYAFSSTTKCCTYVPELANFLVGRILLDDDPANAAGRAAVVQRMAEPGVATPFGVSPSPGYTLLYKQVSETSFGRNAGLKCPYFVDEGGGRCGIWRHRDAVCATWFCKLDRGAIGARFWRMLHQLLFAVERSLTLWCINELDPGSDAVERMFPGQAKPILEWTEAGHADLWRRNGERWGTWRGREREFFEECARRVDALGWPQVMALGGPELRTYLRLVVEAFANLRSDEVPDGLQPGVMRLVAFGKTMGQFWTYSNLDGMELPTRLLDVLHHFDGRPTDDVIREIAATEGVELERRIVRQLADFEILIPARRLSRRPDVPDGKTR